MRFARALTEAVQPTWGPRGPGGPPQDQGGGPIPFAGPRSLTLPGAKPKQTAHPGRTKMPSSRAGVRAAQAEGPQ
eukprot:12642595-Alexandrium_andersonii.AAC.1